MMHWGYMSGWGGLMMGFWMIVFWAVVIGAIVLAVRAFGGGRFDSPSRSNAEQVLADRYARGEIDDAEYRQRLAVLHGSR